MPTKSWLRTANPSGKKRGTPDNAFDVREWPDPRLGERTCAYIVVHGEPLTMADIREHFTQLQVATFKWPERIEHLTEIPRTLVGKMDKKLLQADIAAKIASERPALQSRS